MPDRSDSQQEGITLPPITTLRLLAREEAERMILQHLQLCPFNTDDIQKRVRTIEIGLGRLIGFMIGSGLLGGISGSVAAHFFK